MSAEHDHNPPSVRHLFQRLDEVLDSLCQVLEEEQRWAIERPETPDPELLQRKVSLLQQVEALDLGRQALLREAAMENTADGMQALLAGAGDDEAAAQWTRLLERLRHCQMLNEANGSVIRQQISRGQDLLAALRGDLPTERPDYEADGGRSLRGGRELGRA